MPCCEQVVLVCSSLGVSLVWAFFPDFTFSTAQVSRPVEEKLRECFKFCGVFWRLRIDVL